VCDEGGFRGKLYAAATGKTNPVLGASVILDEMSFPGLLGRIEHVLLGAAFQDACVWTNIFCDMLSAHLLAQSSDLFLDERTSSGCLWQSWRERSGNSMDTGRRALLSGLQVGAEDNRFGLQ
jgi:hypothetical protein